MKITLGSKDLLEKLQIIGAVIPAKSALPILSDFHFEISDQVLQVSAMDMETRISTRLAVEGEGSCDIGVPAKVLVETLKVIDDQPVTFSKSEQNMISITSLTGEYVLPCVDGGEFPKSPEFKEDHKIVIPRDVLANGIVRGMFALSADDLRPMLTGVYVRCLTTGITFAATDAYKLFKYSRADVTAEIECEFVVPKKPLTVIKSALTGDGFDVIVSYNKTNAQFDLNDYTINCRLIDGKYPDFEAIIPKVNTGLLIVDRSKLLKAMKCMGLYADGNTRQVQFEIDGHELYLQAGDVDCSVSARERVECEFDGDPMVIGFNVKFFAEMLSNISSEMVEIELSAANRPGVLRPHDGLAEGEEMLMLVMPVMINKN